MELCGWWGVRKLCVIWGGVGVGGGGGGGAILAAAAMGHPHRIIGMSSPLVLETWCAIAAMVVFGEGGEFEGYFKMTVSFKCGYDDNCYICISIPDVWPGAGAGVSAGGGTGGDKPVACTAVGIQNWQYMLSNNVGIDVCIHYCMTYFIQVASLNPCIYLTLMHAISCRKSQEQFALVLSFELLIAMLI